MFNINYYLCMEVLFFNIHIRPLDLKHSGHYMVSHVARLSRKYDVSVRSKIKIVNSSPRRKQFTLVCVRINKLRG